MMGKKGDIFVEWAVNGPKPGRLHQSKDPERSGEIMLEEVVPMAALTGVGWQRSAAVNCAADPIRSRPVIV
jgi:hypothetical protein